MAKAAPAYSGYRRIVPVSVSLAGLLAVESALKLEDGGWVGCIHAVQATGEK
jgi:hypothetical protein